MVMTSDKPPPRISGGTLLTTADRQTLVAADPDRDLIYVVDIAKQALARRIELSPGDEPGRLTQDKTGAVHVALRGGRSIASFTLGADAPVRRSTVCDLPRGLAYAAATDRLYVACAEGALVQIDPATGKATNRFHLGRDLRDVIARDERLFVTRFRSAEVLEVDPNDGRLLATRKLAQVPELETLRSNQVIVPASTPGGCPTIRTEVEQATNMLASAVAWRTIDVPGRGLVILHQRARASPLAVRSADVGRYGADVCGRGIAHGAISIVDRDSLSADLSSVGLFVDIAADSSGSLFALADAGAWKGGGGFGTNGLVLVTPLTEQQASMAAPNTVCLPTPSSGISDGQVTAVSFVSDYIVAVQEREPAAVSFVDFRLRKLAGRIELKEVSRADTGHSMFHATTLSGVACASCHPEGGDDAHVWTFDKIGPRRTQDLRGGILGTAPFHWSGDMPDFAALVKEVFVGRLAAPELSTENQAALSHWIDRQPALHAQPTQAQAVARGRKLFESEAVGCATCHSESRLTNNMSVDVGTGGAFQVPSLRGVSFRAPFMHDGCALALADAFGACGGGDKHGHTTQLKPEQIADLVAYVESL